MKRPFPRSPAGFTLVEMLVAVLVMAVLAGFAWRGIDAMRATRDAVARQDAAVSRVDRALGQWLADLDAIQKTGVVPALDFDGRVLRLTRRDTSAPADQPALQVVAWALSGRQWLRWASPGVSTAGDLRRLWQAAGELGENTAGLSPPALALLPASAWRVFYFRGSTWVHPQSSGSATAADGSTVQTVDPPDGVRLELFPEGGPFAGAQLRRDWARAATPLGSWW